MTFKQKSETPHPFVVFCHSLKKKLELNLECTTTNTLLQETKVGNVAGFIRFIHVQLSNESSSAIIDFTFKMQLFLVLLKVIWIQQVATYLSRDYYYNVIRSRIALKNYYKVPCTPLWTWITYLSLCLKTPKIDKKIVTSWNVDFHSLLGIIRWHKW